MSGAPRSGVRLDGIVTVHMDSTGYGDYDTLCGIDANDAAIGHEPVAVPRNGRARIDCAACWAIWKRARGYDRKDFVSALTKDPTP